MSSSSALHNRHREHDSSPSMLSTTSSSSFEHIHSNEDDNSSAFSLEGYLNQPCRTLTWDDTNHYKVLTQLHGSVWPRVIWLCLANTILTYVVYQLKHYRVVDLTYESSSHKYMGFLMSFLVVTRLKLIFGHYMASSRYLATCYKSCRDLTAQIISFTRFDTTERAKEWRQDVCFATLLLLRSIVSVLKMRSDPEALEAWRVPDEKSGDGNDWSHDLELANGNDDEEDNRNASRSTLIPTKLAHFDRRDRNPLEEASRMPIFLAFHLRREILKHRDGTWLRSDIWRHAFSEELWFLECVDGYTKAYSGLRDLLIARFPFPLVQLAKTFLFLWVFSVSFTICYENHRTPFTSMAMVFLITYGFCGLEMVSCELDDCFGDDPSDLDALGHATICFEDCYIQLCRVDGPEWAQRLKGRVTTQLYSEEVSRKTYFSVYRWGAQREAFRTPHSSQSSLVELG